jgi:membrane fusion protein (multidrug efflux system)
VQKGNLLAEILDISYLLALIQVPEREIRNFSLGKEVEVRVDALEGSAFFGKVKKMGVEAEQRSRSFPVEIRVDNRDRELRPGMLVRTRVLGGKYAQAILVPRHAVLEREEGRAVYVAEKGVARLRPIVLGAGAGEEVQVLSGLAFGETVIVRGHHRLAPGEPIAVRAIHNEKTRAK